MISPLTCPICEKLLSPAVAESSHFPFCSIRCKQVDLGRWLDGKYAITEPLRGSSESTPAAGDVDLNLEENE